MKPSSMSPEVGPFEKRPTASETTGQTQTVQPTPNPQPETHYPPPSPELIADIRKRLAELPRDVAQYIDEGLRREPIERVANFLWKAGHSVFMLSELYEYRRTLFPPNAMVEPYTAGPPTLRQESTPAISPISLTAHSDSESTPAPPQHEPHPTDNGLSCKSETKAEPLTTDAPHSTHPTDVTDLTHATHVTHATPAPASSAPADSSIQEQASPASENLFGQPSTHPVIHSSTLSCGASLLSDLRDVMNRYVVLPEMAAEALALWVVHTYAFTLRQVTTYIGVVSPEKRCGKTTLLELLGLLANRSLTAANISPSALFRVIEETQPTLLIDEADTFLQGRDELAGILNAGYRKNNSYVVRIADRKRYGVRRQAQRDGALDVPPEFAQWTPERPYSTDIPANNPSIQPSIDPSSDPTIHSSTHPTIPANSGATEFARYSCWCPKVMAAIGRLPDTLADRCVIITMQRKMPGEKCERIRQLNAADFRKRCAEFVRAHSQQIAHAQPTIPSTLNDRAADIWEPLFAIADLAGAEWPELARQSSHKLSASDDDLTLVGYFLKDLRNLMIIRNVDRMLSREVVSALNPLHDRPWEDLRRGREINEWWLGWQLRQLGIRTKSFRVGEAVARGYTLADIEGAFRRYVPNAEWHLAEPTAFLKAEIPNLKSSDDASLKCEISNVKSPDPESPNDAELQRLMKRLLATLPNDAP